MQITQVPEQYIPSIWPEVAPLLSRATNLLENKRTTSLDLFEGCLSGKYNLWVVYDENKVIVAAGITQILEYDQYRALSMQWLGGDTMNNWIDMSVTRFVEFARDTGCKTIEGYGRDAWVRALKIKTGRDWKKAYTVFELNVENE